MEAVCGWLRWPACAWKAYVGKGVLDGCGHANTVLAASCDWPGVSRALPAYVVPPRRFLGVWFLCSKQAGRMRLGSVVKAFAWYTLDMQAFTAGPGLQPQRAGDSVSECCLVPYPMSVLLFLW